MNQCFSFSVFFFSKLVGRSYGGKCYALGGVVGVRYSWLRSLLHRFGLVLTVAPGISRGFYFLIERRAAIFKCVSLTPFFR